MSSLFRRTDRRANLKMFMLAGVVSSELMWIIRTDNKRADLDRQSAAQIKVTRSIIERLKNGENVDVEKELLSGPNALAPGSEDAQQSVSSILQNLEAMDSQWSQQAGSTVLKSPPSSPPPPPSSRAAEKDAAGKGTGFL